MSSNSPLKVAIATFGLANSLRDVITVASDAGAEGVQLDVRSEVAANQFGETASRQLLHSLEERGLKVASTTFPLRRALYDKEQIDGRVAALKEGIRLAARLKCRVLTLRIGRIPGDSQKEDAERLIGALNDLARTGNRSGVTVAVTTSGDAPETLLKLLEQIKEGPVGIDFDPAGCISAQLAPIPVLKSLHDHVLHVQGRDAVRDLETGGAEVPLGRGETPWEEVLAILGDSKYGGWITVRRTTGADRAGDSSRAIAYLRTVATGG